MDYNTTDIKPLLEKFWAGETSSHEENWLKKFFNENPSPKGMEEDAMYFLALSSSCSMRLDSSFDHELMSRIRNKEQRTTAFRWTLRIAASVIFIVGLVTVSQWVFKTDEPPVQITQTTNTTQPVDLEVMRAFEQTKSALLLISSKLNKGQEQTMMLSKFDEAQVRIKPTSEQ
ncbi:MAG: hypothetical protein SH856_10250 [Flavobacteriales bacterium]|nr:hypothetical protein [Flavobacteriales bacterium]